MLIRDASQDDAAAISKLVTESARKHIVPTLSPAGAERLLSEMDEASVRTYLAGDYRFFVAEESSEMIGISAIRWPAHLFYLFVSTEWQGAGIGRRLWERARDCILNQAEPTSISVNSSLNAISAYQRFGFFVTGNVEEEHEVRYQPMRWTGTFGQRNQ